MSKKRDIISRRTRDGFREWFSSESVLREIDHYFDVADIAPDEEHNVAGMTQRRGRVEQHYHALDFTDWRDMQKLLSVYESVLHDLEHRLQYDRDERSPQRQQFDLLVRKLKQDGFRWIKGHLVPAAENPVIPKLRADAEAFDAPYMRKQIDLIQAHIESDPRLAIGTAKELVETTCKTILRKRKVTINKNWNLLQLAKETRAVLKLLPDDIPDSAKSAKSIKVMLSNLGTIAQCIAELRGQFGTGHGPDGKPKGLQPRHARLVAGAATTLAMFLFETDDERP